MWLVVEPQRVDVDVGQSAFLRAVIMYKPRFKTPAQAVPVNGHYDFAPVRYLIVFSETSVDTDIADPAAWVKVTARFPGLEAVHVSAFTPDGTRPPWTDIQVWVHAAGEGG
jgi:hypothetical protein